MYCTNFLSPIPHTIPNILLVFHWLSHMATLSIICSQSKFLFMLPFNHFLFQFFLHLLPVFFFVYTFQIFLSCLSFLFLPSTPIQYYSHTPTPILLLYPPPLLMLGIFPKYSYVRHKQESVKSASLPYFLFCPNAFNLFPIQSYAIAVSSYISSILLIKCPYIPYFFFQNPSLSTLSNAAFRPKSDVYILPAFFEIHLSTRWLKIYTLSVVCLPFESSSPVGQHLQLFYFLYQVLFNNHRIPNSCMLCLGT